MTEEDQKKLNEAWARFQVEKEEAEKRGEAIGTFSCWVHGNRLIDVKVQKRGRHGDA